MEPLSKLEKRWLKRKVHMTTVNCSGIINLMYEVIKLAMCGSRGFSSDMRMRNFVHGDLFHYFLMIRVAIPIPLHF